VVATPAFLLALRAALAPRGSPGGFLERDPRAPESGRGSVPAAGSRRTG
jgi:hypothetical protein